MTAPALDFLPYIDICSECDSLYAPLDGFCQHCEPRESRPCTVCGADHRSIYAMCQPCRTDLRVCTEDNCDAEFRSPHTYIATTCPSHHAEYRICTEPDCRQPFYVNRAFRTTKCRRCRESAPRETPRAERTCLRCADVFLTGAIHPKDHCPRCAYLTFRCCVCRRVSRKNRTSDGDMCHLCKRELKRVVAEAERIKDERREAAIRREDAEARAERKAIAKAVAKAAQEKRERRAKKQQAKARELATRKAQYVRCRSPRAKSGDHFLSHYRCTQCSMIHPQIPKKCSGCSYPKRKCLVCDELKPCNRRVKLFRCQDCQLMRFCATCDDAFLPREAHILHCLAHETERERCRDCYPHGSTRSHHPKACSQHRKRKVSDTDKAIRSRARAARRKQLVTDASVHGGVPTLDDIKALRLGICAYCGGQGTSVDHIRALLRGGWHHLSLNLVSACKRCNSHKSDHLLTEWKDRARVIHGIRHDLRIAEQYAREVAEAHGYDMSWWVPKMEPIRTALTCPESTRQRRKRGMTPPTGVVAPTRPVQPKTPCTPSPTSKPRPKSKRWQVISYGDDI